MSVLPAQQGLSKRNFILGLINGSLFILFTTFIDPDTVLPGFAWQLTGGRPLMVGLLVSIISTGWFLPPLFLSPLLATQRRLMPWYRLSAATRCVALFGLPVVALNLDRLSPGTGFVLITLMYLGYSSSGGLSLIPFMTMVSETIPPNWRGRFFGARYLLGGLMALVAGPWVRWLLSDHSGFGFPNNYALLFLAGAVVALPSMVSFCFAEERSRVVQRRRISVLLELRRGLRIVRRDRNFKRLIVTRCLSAFMLGLTLPFIVPYSLSQLGIGASAVGLFVICKVITYALSNLLWSRVSDYSGNRRLLILSAFMALAALTLVLVVHRLPATELHLYGGLHVPLRVAFVGLIFACFGFSNAGQEIGYTNFLLELIPERKRPTYLSVYYLFWLPLCWVPVLGAVLIGAHNHFMLGFSIAMVLGVAMVFYTFRLREVREVEG
jgi:MFS family permease